MASFHDVQEGLMYLVNFPKHLARKATRNAERAGKKANQIWREDMAEQNSNVREMAMFSEVNDRFDVPRGRNDLVGRVKLIPRKKPSSDGDETPAIAMPNLVDQQNHQDGKGIQFQNKSQNVISHAIADLLSMAHGYYALLWLFGFIVLPTIAVPAVVIFLLLRTVQLFVVGLGKTLSKGEHIDVPNNNTAYLGFAYVVATGALGSDKVDKQIDDATGLWQRRKVMKSTGADGSS